MRHNRQTQSRAWLAKPILVGLMFCAASGAASATNDDRADPGPCEAGEDLPLSLLQAGGSSVLVDPLGGVWVAGTRPGLIYCSDSGGIAEPVRDLRTAVQVLHLDEGRNILAGTKNGVYWIKPDPDGIYEPQASPLPGTADLRGKEIWAIGEDDGEHYWFGTNKGLFTYDRDERVPLRERLKPRNDWKYGSVNAIHRDRRGRNYYLWFGTDCCLVRFDSPTWAQVEGIQAGTIQAISTFGDELLAGGSGGLVRVNRLTLAVRSEIDFLDYQGDRKPQVRAIIHDKLEGRVQDEKWWLATNRGIFLLDGQGVAQPFDFSPTIREFDRGGLFRPHETRTLGVLPRNDGRILWLVTDRVVAKYIHVEP